MLWIVRAYIRATVTVGNISALSPCFSFCLNPFGSFSLSSFCNFKFQKWPINLSLCWTAANKDSEGLSRKQFLFTIIFHIAFRLNGGKHYSFITMTLILLDVMRYPIGWCEIFFSERTPSATCTMWSGFRTDQVDQQRRLRGCVLSETQAHQTEIRGEEDQETRPGVT